ncbi:glycosyltransferase 8 domain-containing protein 1 isoform X2 [Corythoichthys intestinalis]|uniref:glycosyltransferase 8 domain-containing protein 1 isoform X2 n=1 Tax=Corythoichthys intestinalis TaxID=161448 RepID=UPI0025A58F69|nr:glycosyltransferase 8 domain-containing protein 1 isoform X2 [Corythoichthys intestinalis]XP_061814263.1 glycosyltransferase 8 domain-containing protein 1-like [Nerophis lumbriciformis]
MRKVNVVILVLLAVAFLIIIQRNLVSLSDFLHKEITHTGAILPFEAELSPVLGADTKRQGDEIPVVMTAAEERLGAAVAALHSIYQNTKANVVFTIVTLNDTAEHLRAWLSVPRLKSIKYKLVLFNPEMLVGKLPKNPEMTDAAKPLTFARYYLPLYLPDVEKAIYLDDDVIVQGDIKELYETSIKPGYAAAFSDDCDSASTKGIIRGAGTQNNYIGFLDFKKEAIKQLGMRANTCAFNPGVIVANLTEWKNANVTAQLERWMELDARDDLYSKTLAESVAVPPLLIVFYKRHSALDPMWHVRHLGVTGAGNRYSPQFVKAAKLLHWNGHYKPWGRASSFPDVWDRWFIPDPMEKFHPVRRHTGDKLD